MIRSRDNAKIKDIRQLRGCKGERALLEGPHLVGDAAAAGLELDTILAAPDFLASEAGDALVTKLPRRPLEVERRLLDSLCDTDSPRGIVAAARLPRGGVETLPRRPDGVYLFLDGVQDPGNLGAIARSAEATGATGLALAPGSAHPNHPRALRASAGSLLRLAVAIAASAADLDRHLAAASPGWLALTPRGGRRLDHVELAGAVIVAVGAEGPGLSAGLSERHPTPVSIPLDGEVESLNAAVAAALALFEIRRLRRDAQPLAPT